MTRALFLSLLISTAASAYEYGPDPRYTGAPGDAQLACASAGCHTNNPAGGPSNPAGGGVTATFSSGSSYTPGGAPITIVVSVSDPKNTHYGFQMTARLESNLANAQAGDFTAGANQIVLCDDGSTKASGKSCPSAAPVQFIEHAFPAGSQVSTTSYSFSWTPPATNAGPVHFYVAGNAVNGDLKADGNDRAYTASYVLTPAGPCSNPTITNVISAGSYGQLTNFAAGSWLEIYGSNLAQNTNYIQWQGSDFSGPNAPTSLGGSSVSINGNKGFVALVSSSQINLQAPADSNTGQVNIVVNGCSGTSNAFKMQKNALAPGILAPASFQVNGKQYLVAFHADGTYVGNPGLIAGLAFSPAKPGEALVTYGIGFGDAQTKPPNSTVIPPGTIVSAANDLVNPVTFAFGSVPATLQYKGLAPNYVGLYQFNMVVPDVPDGDVQINVTLNGVAIAQKPFLTVHH